jgi:gentisate 1,2-dioxygenase
MPNGCTIPAQGDPTQTQAGGGPNGTSVVYENPNTGGQSSDESLDDPLQQVRPGFSLSCAQKSGFA